MSSYQEQELRLASEAIARGHKDPEDLRQLLILTTSTTTSGVVDAYFRKHLDDKNLLHALVAIAMEGDDAGDAPWAAANVIAEFPAHLLSECKAELVELSQHPWSYLHVPARHALGKIQGAA